MTKHFIFDFETMSQNLQTGVLLDCSYVVFDWDRFCIDDGYTFYELEEIVRRVKFDVQYQVKHLGYTIDKSTLEWWKSQPGAVRDKIQPSSGDVTPEWFLEDLGDYLEDTPGHLKYWWSRSNTFDPIILWRLTDNLTHSGKVPKHLSHWKIRDTRTFIDAKTNFGLKNNNGFVPVEGDDEWNRVFEKHNSSHDIIADILRLQTLTRIENGLSPSKIG